ncbi:MAG: hypothetical protein GEU74_04150 [Nitriliruptorales bacterium]|nr:hypothetical protein [Nitriliruptorales bacterium]
MFKRRRRAAGSTDSDLPFCHMCGQSIRVDASTGRCVLGHRAATPAPAVTPAAAESVDDVTAPVDEPIGGYGAAFAADTPFDSYAELADQSRVWDTADEATQPVGGLDDFLSWDDEAMSSGASSLDISTADLAMLDEPTAADLLEELGGPAAYARPGV